MEVRGTRATATIYQPKSDERRFHRIATLKMCCASAASFELAGPDPGCPMSAMRRLPIMMTSSL